jgi:hypothetical protein
VEYQGFNFSIHLIHFVFSVFCPGSLVSFPQRPRWPIDLVPNSSAPSGEFLNRKSLPFSPSNISDSSPAKFQTLVPSFYQSHHGLQLRGCGDKHVSTQLQHGHSSDPLFSSLIGILGGSLGG